MTGNRQKPITAIIYDLDGTLIDSSHDLSAAMNHALKSLGYQEKSVRLLTSYVGEGLDVFLSRAFETTDPETISRAKKIFQEYYSKNTVVHTRLYDQVAETLAYLHSRGVRQFIISNKPHNFIAPILEHFGISLYFDEIVGQYQFKNIKPHPEAILYLMEKHGLRADSTLMVGDNHTDIEAGHNAGIRTAFCRFGLGTESKNVKADYTLTSFSGLTAMPL
jgi:phosphoglycolate phosphatase